MAVKRTSNTNSRQQREQFQWTAETEAALFSAILLHGLKPVGIAKHFRMAAILDVMGKAGFNHVTAEAVWAKLDQLFNMEAVEANEVVRARPRKSAEFSLPRREFQAIVNEMKKEGNISADAVLPLPPSGSGSGIASRSSRSSTRSTPIAAKRRK